MLSILQRQSQRDNYRVVTATIPCNYDMSLGLEVLKGNNWLDVTLTPTLLFGPGPLN